MARKGGYRSHVDVESLEGKPLVSNMECAGLVQHYTRVGGTEFWREGDPVKDNKKIKKGTAIATFVNGKYPNDKHGNHAALYVSQDSEYLYVVDQWNNDPKKPKISKRPLKFLGRYADKTYIDPSNNGDAFSIIELD